MSWTVLVPLRALPSAKSRLAAVLPPDEHARLVTAIQADTLDAVRSAVTPEGTVARVLVIGDAPGAGVDLVQRSAGLNGALRDGAELARTRWPADGVAALVGDLPALRAAELVAALDSAAAYDSAFAPDASGLGTTLLTARAGVDLRPQYGEGSAARHALGAHRLDAGASVRTDVDELDDLAAAAELGLGPRTAVLFDARQVAHG